MPKRDATSDEIKTTAGPLDCPMFSASSVILLGTSTEVTVVLLDQVAGLSKDGAFELGKSPAAQIALSPVVAKELLVLLDGYISQHEATFGELNSDFLNSCKKTIQ